MIPLPVLKKHGISSKEYYKLSDIKQMKLKMEYDFVKEQTNVDTSITSFFRPFVILLGFITLLAAIVYIYNPALAMALGLIIGEIIKVLIIAFMVILLFDVCIIVYYSKKQIKALNVLFDSYFTKFNRKVKK